MSTAGMIFAKPKLKHFISVNYSHVNMNTKTLPMLQVFVVKCSVGFDTTYICWLLPPWRPGVVPAYRDQKKKQIKLESVVVRAPKTHCHFSYWPLEPAHCILCDIGGPWQKGLFLWSLGFFFSGLGLGGSSLWASFLYSCRSFCASSWGSSTYCNSSSGSLSCSGRLQLTGGWKDRQRNNLGGRDTNPYKNQL